MHIKDALTHKIGPLPGGVWAGIGLVAILAYMHFHKAAPSSSTSSTTDPGVGALDTSGGLLGSGGGGGGSSTPGDTSGGSASGDVGTFTDPTPQFIPIADPGVSSAPVNTAVPAPADSGGSSGGSSTDVIPAPTASPTQTLNVLQSGTKIGTVQAPILDLSHPASDLYNAVGLDPSGGVTLTPQSSPQNATQTLEVAIAQTEQAAQIAARGTGHTVNV